MWTRIVKNWKRRRAFRALVYVGVIAILGLAAFVACVRWLPFDDTRLRNLEVSTVVYSSEGAFLRAYLSRDDRWRIPAEISKVSPWAIKATLAAEDKRFYNHYGVDPVAVARAIMGNLSAGRIVSGASTISMQVAGFALDNRDRTLLRKLKQAFVALQLDMRWSKREILECYLTHASYGGNICGIEAAARRYFNKTAAELSLGEATLLAGLPQSPERYRPDKHLDTALKRRDYVLQRMSSEKFAEPADCARATKIQVRPGLFEVPVIAPHFCDVVRSYYPGNRRPVTTLRLDIQRSAEQTLTAAVKDYRRYGISNGAVMVVENKTGKVVALAGSVDYWNRFDKGQVNGAFGFRSPGSTLKPLIFAEAMDQESLGPDETLFDVPVTIAGYSPMNFDRQFRGPVSASKALAWSLNIPAIEVLRRVGVGTFRDKLMRNSIEMQVNPYGDQGLALAIGTCSVRLSDMTRAYASLATDGVIRDTVWLRDATPPKGEQWISPEASRCVLQILSDEMLRSPEDIDASLAGMHGVAWKTGTSNGFRDAWTFAVTPKFTVGVWVGNMDGKPSRALVGGKVAAPVALSIAKAIKGREAPGWTDDAKSVEFTEVCRVSGLLPGDYCPDLTRGRILAETTRRRRCALHKPALIDKTTHLCVCSACSSGGDYTEKNFANFPSEVSSWLRTNQHPLTKQIKPSHNPTCLLAPPGEAPVIVTPRAGSDIILVEDIPADFQKVQLSARTANPAAVLYWFVNGRLEGKSPAYEPVRIYPKAGNHKVRCVDEQGQSAETWFTITKSGLVEKTVGWSRLSDSN